MPKKQDNTTAGESDRIATLESKVSQLQAKIASLPTTQPKDYDSDIAALQSDIDSLQTELNDVRDKIDGILDEVNATLAAWEATQVEEMQEEQTNNTTRWTLEATSLSILVPNASVVIVVFYSPSRIEEADIYDVQLILYNTSVNSDGDLIPIPDLYLTLTCTPRTGDKVYIDEKNTWLDTMNLPYYLWDMDVLTRGTDKYVRRITFTSEKIIVPEGKWLNSGDPTKGVNPTMLLQLEFNLKYK